MVAEGDKVAVRATFKATHKGPFMGVPPTGKEISSEGMLIFCIADNKIVEHWSISDQLGLMQELGVISLEK
jgi:predicted ester cyclase